MSEQISRQAKAEVEEILLLLITDLRTYRDNMQRELSNPAIGNGFIMYRVGSLTAINNVLGVVDMLVHLYNLNPENEGKIAAGGQAGQQSRGGVRALTD